MMQNLRADLRSALRIRGRARGTTAAAVLTLAVAIGLNLAMFGLIDRALFSPPAHVEDAGRLFTLAFEHELENGGTARMTTTSYVTFEAIRERLPDAAAWQRVTTSAVVNGTQIGAEAMLVSGSYFSVLGATPMLGRGILPEDDAAPSGAPVAVLSYAFWRSAFGSDRAVLGRRITIRGIELTVAGIMPNGFSGHSAMRVDAWIPIHAAMRGTPGWDHDQFRNIVAIVVRVGEESSPAAAAAQAGAAIERRASRVTLSPIGGGDVTATEQRIAYWLTGVSVLVLLIGLANAATLLLVRAAGRRRDLAIRSALGATRARLASQAIVEAALLAAATVGVALLLAYWFDEAVRRVLLPSVTESTGLSLRIIGAAALAGAGVLVVAAAAGIPSTRERWSARSGQAPSTRERWSARSGQALLLVQTTMSVVLLAGAGLFGRSFYNLVSQDFGMRTGDVLLVEFDRGPESGGGHAQLYADALERIRRLPGVEMATTVRTMPFTGFHVPPISVPGRAGPPSVNGQLPFLIAATPEFLEILGVTVVEGRRFVDADDRGAPVVVVNETMARSVWPGESALGKCIRIGFEPSFDPFAATGPPPPPATVPCREVIGVTRDVRQRSVVPTGTEDRLMQYFVPFSQVPPPPAGVGPGPGIQGLLLRTTAGPDVLAAPIRRVVIDGRIDLPFLQVRRYAELFERQMRPWRQGTALLSLFGALALGVAAVGLYASFAHSVGERRREMAIRLALGARPRAVLVMIQREAAGVALAGALCGCFAAILGGRWVESMLFGTAPADPLVLGSAALLMLAVSALATFVPARSASRTDPCSILRAE